MLQDMLDDIKGIPRELYNDLKDEFTSLTFKQSVCIAISLVAMAVIFVTWLSLATPLGR